MSFLYYSNPILSHITDKSIAINVMLERTNKITDLQHEKSSQTVLETIDFNSIYF